MKIRFFILGAEENGASQRLTAEIKCVFADHLDDDGDVMMFSEIKDATTAIAKAVEDTHAIVFIADSNNFGSTKRMLAKAFGFSLINDDRILEKACDSLGEKADAENEDFAVTHCALPENARRFVLDDGLYAGFSVVNGNQTIILIPYDKARTSVLLSMQVIPYLNATYHTAFDNGKFRQYNCDILFDALTKNEVKMAVAGTNTAGFLKDYLYSKEELKELVSFSQIAEKRGSMQPVDYVVNLSIAAAELMSCPYGIAISNAFYTGDGPDSEKIVYLAVTNERESSIREIRSFKGEDIPSFLTRCSGDLCVFISDVLENEKDRIADNADRKKAAAGRYKVAIGIVTALITACAVFCAVYFNQHGYTLRQWADNFIEWVFPAGNPFAGLFDSFVPGEDETNLTDNIPEQTTAGVSSSEEQTQTAAVDADETESIEGTQAASEQ